MFRNLKGVTSATSGYAGGATENPTYEDVCRHETGHAEVVEVEFDPGKITFETLLKAFWGMHNPTTLNQQGPDQGEQYRSAVFFQDEAQKRAAETSKAEAQASGKFNKPIVTEITKAGPFYTAEEYHQQYFKKRGGGYCHKPS